MSVATVSGQTRGQITAGLENQMISVDTVPSTVPNTLQEPVPEPVKQEPEPYHRTHRALSHIIEPRALSHIIDENDLANDNHSLDHSDNQVDDDDCVIIGETSIIPKPLQSTIDSLIKRDNDIISGDKPFTETVRISF